MKKLFFLLAAIILHNNLAICQEVKQEFSKYVGPYLGQKAPNAIPEIFAPDLLPPNKPPHGSPVFTPDGNEMYLPGIKVMKNINGKWTNPVYASFSGKNGDINPTISPDGKKILYCSTIQLRPVGTYIVEKVENKWSEPKQIDDIINTIQREWDISISRKGNIYFSANIQGGFGGSDIYKSEFFNGKYSTPKNLGGRINNSNNVSAVYVSPDEDYIIYSSNMTEGEGDEDLYISFYKKDEGWGKGINMGKNINTKDAEVWPNVTPDGKYLFFIGVRNANAEIYWVSANIIEDIRLKQLH